MIKFLEEEFEHELWGYRKFRKLPRRRRAAPVDGVATDRLRRASRR